MKDRGMMKWLPYRSLVEQKDINDALHEELSKEEKPFISNDKAMEINEILQSYHGQKLHIYYFHQGHRYHIYEKLRKIDVTFKVLTSETRKIPFSEIFALEE